ncbi:MAG: L,D-transpeptidase, partial [Desertifilum sp. SIO1I2]|nr:L,D-transpeptidase [Desertifilum sp. SIO1I2]
YPSSIGQAASEGCLRMHQNDLEELFEQVRLGTLVTVVD